jgi:hypothetical protein
MAPDGSKQRPGIQDAILLGLGFLKMKASRSFETSEYTTPPTQLDTPEGRLHPYSCHRISSNLRWHKTLKKYQFESVIKTHCRSVS